MGLRLSRTPFLLSIAFIGQIKNQVKCWNIYTEHISQCNQSKPLDGASGRIVDLMNENGQVCASKIWFITAKPCCISRLTRSITLEVSSTLSGLLPSYIIAFIDRSLFVFAYNHANNFRKNLEFPPPPQSG